MKKVYSPLLTAVACIAFLQVANAQFSGKSVSSNPVVNASRLIQPGHFMSTVVDTIWPPAFTQPCFDSLTYYDWVLPDSGYCSGNNAIKGGTVFYHGTETAQRCTFSGNGTITDVLVDFAYVTGTNGTTSAKVYGVTNQKPGTLMATSSNTITTGILVPNSITDYMFTPPVAVTTNFCVSAVFPNPANGDTVVVVSTELTCNSADSLATLNIDGGIGWYYYYMLFGPTPAPTQDFDLIILPVVDVTTGISDPPTSNGLSLLGAYPNPAHLSTTVRYKSDRATQATIKVFDLSGKASLTATESISVGEHQFVLDLKDLAAGHYFYTIRTDDATMTSKFSVIK